MVKSIGKPKDDFIQYIGFMRDVVFVFLGALVAVAIQIQQSDLSYLYSWIPTRWRELMGAIIILILIAICFALIYLIDKVRLKEEMKIRRGEREDEEENEAKMKALLDKVGVSPLDILKAKGEIKGRNTHNQ